MPEQKGQPPIKHRPVGPEPEPPKAPEVPKEHVGAPIVETEDSVSYLGVKLPKAENRNSPFVPNRKKYATDFVEDTFILNLEKQIAVSFNSGDPVYVEGGTSIGKTRTIRKMASDLGWEVHYASVRGLNDPDDLMGRYLSNPNRKTANDPEFIFIDGKITSGLRQEEGKTKVIIIDEINFAGPKVLIRLHEVLDALEMGESVVLSEDASQNIPVDKTKTKIIALANPPGKGYFGREPIDPALLRRWVYIKMPSELPKETFSYATDAMFHLAPKTEPPKKEEFLESREMVLTPEELNEIPGIAEIVAKYREFHEGAKNLVGVRRIGTDQPQPFTFDDRMEPRRIRDFILRFYNGDITDTVQKALRYYYVNKLESKVNRDALEVLVELVKYIPPVTTARKGFERAEKKEFIFKSGQKVLCAQEPMPFGKQGEMLSPSQEVTIKGEPHMYLGLDLQTGEAVIVPKDQLAPEPEKKK